MLLDKGFNLFKNVASGFVVNRFGKSKTNKEVDSLIYFFDTSFMKDLLLPSWYTQAKICNCKVFGNNCSVMLHKYISVMYQSFFSSVYYCSSTEILGYRDVYECLRYCNLALEGYDVERTVLNHGALKLLADDLNELRGHVNGSYVELADVASLVYEYFEICYSGIDYLAKAQKSVERFSNYRDSFKFYSNGNPISMGVPDVKFVSYCEGMSGLEVYGDNEFINSRMDKVNFYDAMKRHIDLRWSTTVIYVGKVESVYVKDNDFLLDYGVVPGLFDVPFEESFRSSESDVNCTVVEGVFNDTQVVQVFVDENGDKSRFDYDFWIEHLIEWRAEYGHLADEIVSVALMFAFPLWSYGPVCADDYLDPLWCVGYYLGCSHAIPDYFDRNRFHSNFKIREIILVCEFFLEFCRIGNSIHIDRVILYFGKKFPSFSHCLAFSGRSIFYIRSNGHLEFQRFSLNGYAFNFKQRKEWLKNYNYNLDFYYMSWYLITCLDSKFHEKDLNFIWLRFKPYYPIGFFLRVLCYLDNIGVIFATGLGGYYLASSLKCDVVLRWIINDDHGNFETFENYARRNTTYSENFEFGRFGGFLVEESYKKKVSFILDFLKDFFFDYFLPYFQYKRSGFLNNGSVYEILLEHLDLRCFLYSSRWDRCDLTKKGKVMLERYKYLLIGNESGDFLRYLSRLTVVKFFKIVGNQSNVLSHVLGSSGATNDLSCDV